MKRHLIAAALAVTALASWPFYQPHPPALLAAVEAAPAQPAVLSKTGQMLDWDALVPALLEQRVVFIGEFHDRYDHHLNQLALIRALHEREPGQWALALEFFQQPFQKYLNRYVEGKISEQEMLEKTEYFQRWRFDYRLYRPILSYAREQGIPVIALNVPAEITRKVGQGGIKSLNDEEKVWVPGILDKSDEAYRTRLQEIYAQHDGANEEGFENFLEAQLLWDEGMAERAARYLAEHPTQSLVVLAGSGHLLHGSGIPNRLQRRMPIPAAIVLQDDPGATDQQGADYLLLTGELPLPPVGRIGVMLEPTETGMDVQAVLPDSGAQQAGIQEKDRIVSIANRAVLSMEDVQLAMLGRLPGEAVQVKVQRQNGGETAEELAFEVVLR